MVSIRYRLSQQTIEGNPLVLQEAGIIPSSNDDEHTGSDQDTTSDTEETHTVLC